MGGDRRVEIEKGCWSLTKKEEGERKLDGERDAERMEDGGWRECM